MKMIFSYYANKTHFHNKGFALSLVLKVRFFGTRKWPINMFCIVGDVDPVVPCNFGEMSKGVLTSFCSKVEFKKYTGMGHSSSDQVSLFSLCDNDIFFVNSQSI